MYSWHLISFFKYVFSFFCWTHMDCDVKSMSLVLQAWNITMISTSQSQRPRPQPSRRSWRQRWPPCYLELRWSWLEASGGKVIKHLRPLDLMMLSWQFICYLWAWPGWEGNNMNVCAARNYRCELFFQGEDERSRCGLPDHTPRGGQRGGPLA